MSLVVGVFEDEPRAVAALESLRTGRFDTDKLRLIGGPDNTVELGADVGASAVVAAGPVRSVLDAAVAADLSADELKTVRERLEAGAVLVMGEDLDSEAAERLTGFLRENRAEPVIVRDHARS